MTEYVPKDQVLEIIKRTSGDYAAAWAEVNKLPAADVAPVVYGRWENGNAICPVCGKDKFKDLDADIWCDWKPAYCPNSGAKMDLEVPLHG